MPVNAVIAAEWDHCSDGALLGALRTTGKRPGHSLKSIWSSAMTDRSTHKSSLPSLSTAPLLHGEYRRVK